jgi:5-methyltetrahydropteroyltriglutamate--homocysteine methyltransferase
MKGRNVNQRAGGFRTTHTGSLPRPPALSDLSDAGQVKASVEQLVRRQLEAGIDIVSDGEASKPSYATYVTQRLTGFRGERPARHRPRGADEFPEFFATRLPRSAITTTPVCQGPVAYIGTEQVEADVQNLRSSAGDQPAFLTAASPGVIELWMPNAFYASTEQYLFALADAMKAEYDAIHAAGITLQLDCPDIPGIWSNNPGCTAGEFRAEVAMRLAAIDHAIRDIPGEAVRLHICWGNYQGPHNHDVPLASFLDLVLKAKPQGISFEAANPRHEHEWALFEDVRLPDGKVLLPGVIDSTSSFIEHPELVAQRILRFAAAVGAENVIASADCGFATVAGLDLVDPEIAWAKLAAMCDGAAIATRRLAS